MTGRAEVTGRTVGSATEKILREQLRQTVIAAQSAYQDTSRLIRLLSILGHPGTPEALVEEALTALSEVFTLDVASVVRVVGDRLVVIASCGLPESDPAFTTGWVPSSTARAVIRDGRALARRFGEGDGAGGARATATRAARTTAARTCWCASWASDRGPGCRCAGTTSGWTTC